MSNEQALDSERLALPCGEQFLIWALRLWVKAFKEKGNLHATLYKGFCLTGVEEGYFALDELLTVVSHSATTSIDVRCQNCGAVSTDEQLFIGQIAALQRADFATSRQLMGYWLDPASIRMAETPAVRLANLMTVADLTLRPRVIDPPTESLDEPNETPDCGRAMSTLH